MKLTTKNTLREIPKMLIITLIFTAVFSFSLETETSLSNSVLISSNRSSKEKTPVAGGRDKKLFPFSTKLTKTHSGGDISTLKHLNPSCRNNEALTGFNLWGKIGFESTEVATQYSCLSSLAITNQKINMKSNLLNFKSKSKSGESSRRKVLNVLGNLTVKCPKNAVIKGFVLKQRKEDFHYKYSCVKVSLGNCMPSSTSFVKFDGLRALDKLSVKANEGFAIQMFQGVRKGNRFKYVYSQCKVREASLSKIKRLLA